MKRPETHEECKEFLDGNASIEAWEIKEIDGVMCRHRCVKMELDANNKVHYLTITPENDETETRKWMIRAAQHLYDAAEAHAAYVKSGH